MDRPFWSLYFWRPRAANTFFCLYCAQSCLCGKEERRFTTAATLKVKLTSLSRILNSWQCYTITLRKILLLFQRLSYERTNCRILPVLFQGKLSLQEGRSKAVAALIAACTHPASLLLSRGWSSQQWGLWLCSALQGQWTWSAHLEKPYQFVFVLQRDLIFHHAILTRLPDV